MDIHEKGVIDLRYVELGSTGLKASVIGFGGIPIQRVSTEEACRVIHAALDAGVNFILLQRQVR